MTRSPRSAASRSRRRPASRASDPRARTAVRSEPARLRVARPSLSVLGTAGLPHVLMRFYTVPTAKEARRSVVWAIWIIGIFYLFTPGARLRRRRARGCRRRSSPHRAGSNSAAPLLALELGGPVLLGIISAVAFATILAVVAGLTITAATSFAHDIYANVIKKGDGHVGLGRRGQDRAAHGRRHRRRRDPRRHRSRRGRTWRSSSRSPSPSRRARTCRRSCSRCSGSASTPAARCWACTAVWRPRSC